MLGLQSVLVMLHMQLYDLFRARHTKLVTLYTIFSVA